jgi:hypothetical protein
MALINKGALVADQPLIVTYQGFWLLDGAAVTS